MHDAEITVYVKSTSDNTPGHAGIGLVITGAAAQEISEYIGIASAEQAMYQAVIQAFSFASEHEFRHVRLCSDNQELLHLLRQRHCPNLSIDVSSLHKRAVQSARYHQVCYSLVPGDDSHIIRAAQLAEMAVRDRQDGDKIQDNGADKHSALQQSAGGVVYKRQGQQIKVCLIAKKDGKIWALPKGRLQPGESWEGTAVREVLEETGHLATIAEYIDQIDYYFYWKDNHTMYYKLVAFFLMPVIVENHRQPDGEADKVVWFTIGDALHNLHYQSEKNILRQAQQLLRTVF